MFRQIIRNSAFKKSCTYKTHKCILLSTKIAYCVIQSKYHDSATTETWRSAFDDSLNQLQQCRSWGRSQGVFDGMSALPGDLVSAPWRAAAAHNAGCAALRLGQHAQAAEHFERALRLRSGDTSDAFAAVAAVSNLGIGVCLLAQHARTPAVGTATDHLIAAHEAANRSAGTAVDCSTRHERRRELIGTESSSQAKRLATRQRRHHECLR